MQSRGISGLAVSSMSPAAPRSVSPGAPPSALSWLILFSTVLSLCPCVQGEDRTKTAEPKVKVSEDFAKWKIKTIRMLGKPAGNSNPAKSTLFDAISGEVTRAGYEVVTGFTNERKESEARLTMDFESTKGMSQQAHARKHGFNSSSSAENYSLSVTVRITVKDGGATKEIFSARCKMWHKFVPHKVQDSKVEGSYIVTTWPIDHYGEGPGSLDEAAAEMAPLLMKDLPPAEK